MFKIGNFYYPDGGGAFWENLFISIASALLGVAFAWIIFKKTIQHDKKEDEYKKQQYLIGRMRFLSILLKDVIDTTDKQIENFITQAEDILINPYEIHLVKILASNQLKRLANIDSQDIFEAYLFLFENDQQTVQAYIKLLNKLDFLEKYLEQVFSSNESNVKTVGARQDEMKIYIDQLYSGFPKFCQEDILMKAIWTEYMPIFESHIGTGKADIKKLHHDFLIPLFRSVNAIITEKVSNKNAFLTAIRNATTTIEHCQSNNARYARDEALAIKHNLRDVISSLKDDNQKIEQKLRKF